jgi:hypothetical protein
MSTGDVFDSIDAVRNELATPTFAADHAGAISPVTRQLASDLELGHDTYDAHMAHASGTMHHDQRPLEHKAGPAFVPHGGNGGDGGSGWPGPGQPPPWWPPGKGNGGGGTGGSGNGGSGSGPPSWFKKWWQNQQQQRGRGGAGGAGGARGLGGAGLAGPGAIGNVPQLGKVPIPPPGSSTSGGASPIVILLVLASLGVGGYLLWHKLKLAKHQDAQLAAGQKPDADSATS